jgi:hypothetical protein
LNGGDGASLHRYGGHRRLTQSWRSPLPWKTRIASAIKAGLFYASWYPQKWLPKSAGSAKEHIRADVERLLRLTHHFGKLARHRIHQTFTHLRTGTHNRTSQAIAKELLNP